MRDSGHGTWPSVLSDPVGVPRNDWLWTQGAPASRRPWAMLLNRFTVLRRASGTFGNARRTILSHLGSGNRIDKLGHNRMRCGRQSDA